MKQQSIEITNEQVGQELDLPGSNIARLELRKLLDYIRKGDTITVTKLDRLARSTKDLLSIAEEIKRRAQTLRLLISIWIQNHRPGN